MTTATASTCTYAPFIESTPNESDAVLRARLGENGYLFFRNLVPQEAVFDVRRDILELCAEAGWLHPDYDMMDAIVRPGQEPCSEGHAEYMKVYRQVLKLPRFHDFPLQTSLLDIAARVLECDGEKVLTHPRRIGRITFPNFQVATTPAHQDHFYIRGSENTYSCWMPLGDCPQSLGGLAIWNGSHTRGFLEHSEHSPGAVGGRGVPVDEEAADWHSCDFRAGDALFFHAFTIHKALPNLSENQLRISTDNRYQLPADAIDPSALLPHFGAL